jgi:type I restriction enzyme M protein
MSEQNDDIIEAPQDEVEDNGPENFFIDILTCHC